MQESEGHIDRQTEIRHLLRTVKTALELAIVAPAPADLVNRLARVSGLLGAVTGLPLDDAPVRALTTGLIADAVSAVDEWQRWEKTRTPVA
jgi:hypothetical protein